MASALLISGNEHSWEDRTVCMKKIPNSNPNPMPGPFRSSSRNAADHASDRVGGLCPMGLEEIRPADGTVPAAPSSLDRKSVSLERCNGRDDGEDRGRLVVFKISRYSKRELKDLKRRLESELDQVRDAISRFEKQEHELSARSTGLGNLDPSVTSSIDFLEAKEKVKTRTPEMSPATPESERMLRAMMVKCDQILARLMKHKKCIWFSSPVDVVGMGLHDYHTIIKNPMDLGTVKSRLSKGFYISPEVFAADVRLTFKNALLYNPQGHEVHKLAGNLLGQFEGSFEPVFQKYEKKRRAAALKDARHKMPFRPPVPLQGTAMRPESPPAPQVSTSNPTPPTLSNSSLTKLPPVIESRKPQAPTGAHAMARTSAVRPPKLKAKDLQKRTMSFEEKQKLILGLQNLPDEKMTQVIQIVSKMNVETTQQTEDGIELDIQALDTETLWELDQFLCNWNKTMSKMRRQEAVAGGPISVPQAETDPLLALQAGSINKSLMLDDTPETEATKTDKKNNEEEDDYEEDVDIGDELPSTIYPSVEIEKDDGIASDSHSDSYSSDSSSGSDSDEDDDKSP